MTSHHMTIVTYFIIKQEIKQTEKKRKEKEKKIKLKKIDMKIKYKSSSLL